MSKEVSKCFYISVAIFICFMVSSVLLLAEESLALAEGSQSQAPSITQQDLERGWYWGNRGQKKAGTPFNWIHSGEGTRSACWYKPGVRCGSEIHQIGSGDSTNEDFPFGIQTFGFASKVAKVLGITTWERMVKEIESKRIPNLEGLKIKWVRQHSNFFGTFGWTGVDADHDGEKLDFSLQDALIKLAQEYQIHVLPVLSPLPFDTQWLQAKTYVPKDKAAYSAYVRQIVERYDGDGKDDMPDLKYPIKYWQLENEPDLHNRVRERRGNPDFCSPWEYFEVLKLTYKAVKEADKEAKVILNVVGIGQDMGNTSATYLIELGELGVENYYDIFSYHVYADSYDTAVLKSHLRKFKRFIGEKPVWITESGIGSREAKGRLEGASETAQASWVIKHHVFHVANGVKRLFWLTMTDMSPNVPEGQMAKYAGLLTFRPGKPKLSYYTYKKMVEVLEGSDWDNIETIQEAEGIYIYKFNKQSRPIWVAWNDNKKPRTIRIILDKDTNNVKITEAVPEYKSGKDVIDYSTTVKIKTKTVQDGDVIIMLEDIPIFIEAK